jgi:hypothetical protein
MTDDMMALQGLMEKSADVDILREMIGFAAQRLTASTAGSPSLSTAVRLLTIWRSLSAAPASLRWIRSRPVGSTQSLNGTPFLSAPGLRASTGT